MNENTVQSIRQRLAQFQQVQAEQDRAVCLLAQSACAKTKREASALTRQSVAVKRQADKLAKAYYKQFPRCMSRQVNAWAV